MKFSIAVLAFLFPLLLIAQNRTDFPIDGNTFGFEYDEVKQEFFILKIDGDVTIKTKYNLTQKGEFDRVTFLNETVEAYMNKQQFQFLWKDTTLGAVNDIKFDDLKIELSKYEDFKNGEKANITIVHGDKKDSLTIEESKKGNLKYTVTPPSHYLTVVDAFDIEFTKVERDNDTNATKKIQDELIVKLKKATVDKASAFKNSYENQLKFFYNKHIRENDIYKYLTSETMKDQKEEEEAVYSFALLVKKDHFFIQAQKPTAQNDTTPSPIYLYRDLALDITVEEFITNFQNQHKLFDTGDPKSKASLTKIHALVRTAINSKIVTDENKTLKGRITSLIDSIEKAETKFSGTFLLREEFKLEKRNTSSAKKKKGTKEKKYIESNEVFQVSSATIRFFNNRVDNLSIVGSLKSNPSETFTLQNRLYSIPLREFSDRRQTNTFNTASGMDLKYNYDDVLDYLPTDHHNYAIRNDELKIVPNDSVKVKERKIGDYFTGIFYTDILGLNSNNSNSLIVAEAKIRVPWNLRNFGRLTLFDHFSVYASVNLFSGIESSSRKVKLDDKTISPGDIFVEKTEAFRTDNFNLLLNNNLDAGLQLTPITFEWKGANTFLHIQYGLRFLRTGVEYDVVNVTNVTGQDGQTTMQRAILETREFQVFSLGHEAELNIEIRPQSTVGVDIILGANWISETGTNKNDLDFSASNDSANLKAIANIYSFLDPKTSKSGVSARLGVHYNLGTSKIFPQLMIGYATNLTSFVNKVQQDKE